jgi:hypothetical protein
MKTNAARKTVVKAAPTKKRPFSLQQLFDTWLLPLIFVAGLSLVGWAVWRR